MRWLKGEDHPKEPGQYHCNIESENFKGKSIHKDTCWFSSGGIWLSEYSNQRVVSWLDENTHSALSPEVGDKVLRWVKASERLPGGPRNENSEVIVRPLGNSKLATVTFIWSSDNPQWYDTRYFLDDTEWLEEIDGPTAQPTETPAPGEVPADIMEWITENCWKENMTDAAIAMYHKMQEQIATLQNQAANTTKDMGKLLEDIGALQDALKLIIQKSEVLKSNPNCADILDIAERALQ